MQLLTILGGTFDPIHNGHLRLALDIINELALSEIYLMPARVPPHRPPLQTKITDRINMLQLATEICPQIKLDLRELERDGPSYTVDTLRKMRQEIPPQQPLAISVGIDSFLHFNQWHNWQEIINLAHIIITPRINIDFKIITPDILSFYQQHAIEDPQQLTQQSAGYIYRLKKAIHLEISATQIRDLLKHNKSPQFLVPDIIFEYIIANKLYCN